MTLALEAWDINDAAAEVTFHVTSTQAWVPCPRCHVQTSRVHSRYTRTLADLPWGAYAVRIQLRVRKFFCDHPACPRQIFTERLPTVAAPWARRTLRLAQRLLACGIARGRGGWYPSWGSSEAANQSDDPAAVGPGGSTA